MTISQLAGALRSLSRLEDGHAVSSIRSTRRHGWSPALRSLRVGQPRIQFGRNGLKFTAT